MSCVWLRLSLEEYQRKISEWSKGFFHVLVWSIWWEIQPLMAFRCCWSLLSIWRLWNFWEFICKKLTYLLHCGYHMKKFNCPFIWVTECSESVPKFTNAYIMKTTNIQFQDTNSPSFTQMIKKSENGRRHKTFVQYITKYAEFVQINSFIINICQLILSLLKWKFVTYSLNNVFTTLNIDNACEIVCRVSEYIMFDIDFSQCLALMWEWGMRRGVGGGLWSQTKLTVNRCTSRLPCFLVSWPWARSLTSLSCHICQVKIFTEWSHIFVRC